MTTQVPLNMLASAPTFRNRLINGAMMIDQRNAGASGTAVNTYTIDRWEWQASQTGKATWGQNLGSVTPPTGFSNYLGLSSSSAYSLGSTDYFEFTQIIEGYNCADLAWGTSNAKTVTLSFWVYSSLTGTFGGAIRPATGSIYTYPFSYTISTANTWTQISVTIPGPTATWNAAVNNTGNIVVVLSVGMGSTYSGTAGSWSTGNYNSVTGATSVVGTNGATFYITGVQLEVGSSATGFEYRQYGQELALCQRYYWKNLSGASNVYLSAQGSAANTTVVQLMLNNPVPMRAGATYSIQNSPLIANGASTAAVSSISANYANQFGTQLTVYTSTSVFTVGQAVYLYSGSSNTAFIDASAEL